MVGGLTIFKANETYFTITQQEIVLADPYNLMLLTIADVLGAIHKLCQPGRG